MTLPTSWGVGVDARASGGVRERPGPAGLEQDRLLDIAAGCGGTDVEFTPAP
ncbi:hypothetical protein ACGFNX_27035 [Streptomyces sp. NPDC048723]|uniref:hypothetical protein n=1 Tax=Streptomyces sp. NPDC048723 TaxID=3365589 RepID=UPI003713D217